MNRKIKKLIIAWICFGLLVVLMFVGIRKIIQIENEGKPVEAAKVLTQKVTFDSNTDITSKSAANYLAYLDKAYILFGTYPDCEYYKISANVTRNEYDWAKDFYVQEGGLYKNYYKNGVASGTAGIDVSEFQGDIDWTKVKAAGIGKAFLRVGYRGYGADGKITQDAKYNDNVAGAIDAGISTGVYFYSEAVNYAEGAEEANFCLQQIKDHNITEPVVCDTEYMYGVNARANGISSDNRTDAILGFCETIEKAGYTPMVYASRDWFIKNINIDKIGKYKLWLAAYETPVFPYHTEGYQYSNQGYVDGISSAKVDLDVFMY